jgi:hypothetical protein
MIRTYRTSDEADKTDITDSDESDIPDIATKINSRRPRAELAERGVFVGFLEFFLKFFANFFLKILRVGRGKLFFKFFRQFFGILRVSERLPAVVTL